jgi:uncharacterized membrane protein
MTALLHEFNGYLMLALEALSVLMILVGSIEAVWRLLHALVRRQATHGLLRAAWLGLARWMMLGLEFMLAADIIRSLTTPTWDDIGKLAAIALIRTFLNFFLERDLENAARHSEPSKIPTQESA